MTDVDDYMTMLRESQLKRTVVINDVNKIISENTQLKQQLAIAKDFIFRCANDISGDWYINSAKCVLKQIEDLDK